MRRPPEGLTQARNRFQPAAGASLSAPRPVGYCRGIDCAPGLAQVPVRSKAGAGSSDREDTTFGTISVMGRVSHRLASRAVLMANGSLSQSLAALAFRAGPVTSAGAILWVHGDNIARHSANYVKAPPTISHALLDPAIADPFAWAMIVSAVFLSFAIVQVVGALYRIIAGTARGRAGNLLLLSVITLCEAVAVAGMIVLSQYTGNIDSHIHDVGSYMLFFGHALGIGLSGVLIRRLLANAPASDALLKLRRNPRNALAIALLSALYGVIYFGGKVLPDEYFFWQRALLSGTEVVVILSFLAYLSSFWPMVRMSRLTAGAERATAAAARAEG